ncbi:MAG: HAD-IA family hydrolase [Deltaproteobacteria bacterium]|nr:HAD-IA family hydrolase [Deltaproteobacteria bacterium]
MKKSLFRRPSDPCFYVLLDFDGVLSDSWDVFLSAVNAHSGEYNFTPVRPQEAKDMTTRELLDKYQLGTLNTCRLVKSIKKYIQSRMDEIGVFRDFSDLCHDLHRQENIRFAIISSNSKENIAWFIDKYELSFIGDIVSNARLFGKEAQIRRYIRKNRLRYENCLYVGDEVRDIEAARKAGISSLAVTWGYDPERKLSESRPSYLAKNAREAFSSIKEFVSMKL